MGEELTYLDLLVLRKIDSDSSVEKFGQQISTSFFETANVLGTMKIKGFVDIQSSIGGQSPLVVTGTGSDILATAMQKAAEPIDSLDQAILKAIGGGARELGALTSTLNIRSADMAFHLHKLKSQDYIDHEVRSAKVMLSLTEKGFILTGGAVIKPAAPAPVASVASSPIQSSPVHPIPSQSSGSAVSTPNDIQDIMVGMAKPKPTAPAAHAPARPASTSAQTSLPEYSGPKVLDKQAMLFSKLEYYVKAYAPYAVLLVLLCVFVAYAVLTGMNKPAS